MEASNEIFQAGRRIFLVMANCRQQPLTMSTVMLLQYATVLQPKVLVFYSDKKLLGAPGIATRSKDATWGCWPYY